MFTLAIVIGVFSYLIFLLGITGFLYKPLIQLFTIGYWMLVVWWYRDHIRDFLSSYNNVVAQLRNNKLSIVILVFFVLLVTINLIGALGPEYAFDAVWYHLTLPKLYLIEHTVRYIPSSLLYYSAMPQFMEMLYVSSLVFGGEVGAKLIHFSFGIFTAITLYLFSRKYLSQILSLLVALIFYSNLVVAWESITAYIDLGRTLYELLALWAFSNWWDSKQKKWLLLSAVMLGFAITTKLLVIGSLGIFLVLILYKLRKQQSLWQTLGIYIGVSMLVSLPWFLYTYLSTGNPVYPFFTTTYPVTTNSNLLSPLIFLKELWILFTRADDPLSPLYIMSLPLLILYMRTFSVQKKLILLYSIGAILVWYVTPRTGGGRFILPYLPAFSLLVGFVVEKLQKRAYYFKVAAGMILFCACITLGYRGMANVKYVPVFVGTQSKSEFLTKHLNFTFGDFYDTDGYFAKKVSTDKTVLLYGFHNLYYVDFPFIHESWVKKGDIFTYVATQHTIVPPRFHDWKMIYENTVTGVKLYAKGEKPWVY